jgi:hypothetical protein
VFSIDVYSTGLLDVAPSIPSNVKGTCSFISVRKSGDDTWPNPVGPGGLGPFDLPVGKYFLHVDAGLCDEPWYVRLLATPSS